MKRVAFVICALFTVVCLLSWHDAEGRVRSPKLKEMGGQEVSTEYFDLTIPQGWSMPVPPKKMPNEGMTVVFGSMSQDPAISISVMKSPMSAKEIGEATLANMKKNGMTVTPLEEKDGLWVSEVTQGKGHGRAWFGNADGKAAVTIVTGNDLDKANEIFTAIKPKINGLLPGGVN